MANSSSNEPIQAFSPSRQVAFHQLLVGARRTWLADALSEVLATTDTDRLRSELGKYVPADIEKILASSKIRTEYVFPTPVVLESRPTLLGYYRLLLGVSQKLFYRRGTGMGRFKSMEMSGTLNEWHKENLGAFCAAMSESLSALILQLSPGVTERDVSELPLLTLGSQFQGGNNVAIGRQATVEVFLAIGEIVEAYTKERHENQIKVTNASGRQVLIRSGSDPDVRIVEDFGGDLRRKVAIEIKGGTDVSNVHNRAGEAEKSHQKAKNEGFRDFWTVILTKGVDVNKLRAESPTTNSWFDAAQVLGRTGPDWDEFKSRIAGEVGIPVGK